MSYAALPAARRGSFSRRQSAIERDISSNGHKSLFCEGLPRGTHGTRGGSRKSRRASGCSCGDLLRLKSRIWKMTYVPRSTRRCLVSDVFYALITVSSWSRYRSEVQLWFALMFHYYLVWWMTSCGTVIGFFFSIVFPRLRESWYTLC